LETGKVAEHSWRLVRAARIELNSCGKTLYTINSCSEHYNTNIDKPPQTASNPSKPDPTTGNDLKPDRSRPTTSNRDQTAGFETKPLDPPDRTIGAVPGANGASDASEGGSEGGTRQRSMLAFRRAPPPSNRLPVGNIGIFRRSP